MQADVKVNVEPTTGSRSTTNEKDNSPNSSNQPEMKFRAGAIQATVWRNEGVSKSGEPTSYQTITLERGYMDKDGNWHSAKSLRVADLPKAQLVLRKAYEALIMSE